MTSQVEDAASVEARIVALCEAMPQGINDKVIQNEMPNVDPRVRAQSINILLAAGRLDLFKSKDGLLYKLKSPSKATSIRGDQEEKIVYKIIETSGNLGIWLRDIRSNSGLMQTQLNKVLKSLESKRLIKSVKSVNATKKRVYMLFDLDPDPSVTGGTWYSDQDFESEFVEILNQQCHRFLEQKMEKSAKLLGGPFAKKTGAMVSNKEILTFISELGISKVQLTVQDVDAIMNTLVFDGKAEISEVNGDTKFYVAVKSAVPSPGLVTSPCGLCPVIENCGDSGSIRPTTCQYFRQWLQF